MKYVPEGGPVRIDRRRFIHTTGVLAVGSAIGSSLTGCNAELNVALPSLGPALPPTPVPGMTYIWASKIGCALDCNLGNGLNKNTGGAATDDGPRINAAMAGATADKPITLIIDGSALISGLFLPVGGYWSIAGLGSATGFYTKSGSNCDAIQNGSASAEVPFNPGPPAPTARGSNVSLSNFTLNGNQNRVSTSGMRQGTNTTWYCGIDLINLNNISIENLVVVYVPAFHIRLSNVGNVTVSGCILQSAGFNTDGVHFDGPANDISISNCKFTTGDDAIALNCPEGYTGNISRVTVRNCTFDSLTLMRLYTVAPTWGPMFYIDTVNVSNCSGTLVNSGFLIGTCKYSNPNSVTGLTISDCTLTAPSVLDLAANFGTIVLSNITLNRANTGQAPGFALVRSSPELAGMTYIGASLSIANCVLSRNGNFDASALILDNGSTVENLELNGLVVQDATGKSYSPALELIEFVSGTIGQLVLDAVTSTKIEAPVSAGGFGYIGAVSGSGVLATDWEFPDAVMANNVPYISATNGQPSIKINGVVEPYDPS